MGSITIWTVEKPYLTVGGSLLEGPSYDTASDELRWIDIIDEQVYIHKLSESPEKFRKFDLKGNTVSTISGITGSDSLVNAGAKFGFATFDPVTGSLSYFRSYFDNAAEREASKHRFRANDGAIDARGRIFQGIMIDEKVAKLTPHGMLLRLDTDGRLTRVVENVLCPNGLGWNAANTIMYWAESRSGNVYAFDYDLDTGSATGQRVFFHLHVEDNTNAPDGLVVDERDHVWLAIWGSSKVVRISPEGVVVAEIRLPTRFVTCPVFVGSELVVTTAAEREPDTYPESARMGGHIYRVEVGVRGLPKFESLHPSRYEVQTGSGAERT